MSMSYTLNEKRHPLSAAMKAEVIPRSGPGLLTFYLERHLPSASLSETRQVFANNIPSYGF